MTPTPPPAPPASTRRAASASRWCGSSPRGRADRRLPGPPPGTSRPDITIRFKTGDRPRGRQDRIKFKDVDVGQIDSVSLPRTAAGVIAGARLARSADHLLVDDTRFWMVSARVSGSAVSGLAPSSAAPTWASTPANPPNRGATSPPSTTRRWSASTCRAATCCTPKPSAPSAWHPIISGACRPARSPATAWANGKRIEVRVFIKAPYDRFVTATPASGTPAAWTSRWAPTACR